jgi:hypothetical protein
MYFFFLRTSRFLKPNIMIRFDKLINKTKFLFSYTTMYYYVGHVEKIIITIHVDPPGVLYIRPCAIPEQNSHPLKVLIRIGEGCNP